MNEFLAVVLTGAGVVVMIFAIALFLAWAATGRAREAVALASLLTAGLTGVLIVLGAVIGFLSMVWAGVA